MCGIAGVLGASSELFVKSAISVLAHRGPDGDGLMLDEQHRFSVAHRRLSIIDQSTAASQPMLSLDGRFVMVFNGEVYNYHDLANELFREGVDVREQGDSRVLLEGYRVWGRDVVSKLRGMFAFVIIDRLGGDEQHAFALAARDRLGIKPLYFGKIGGGVGFSSEVRPFIKTSHATKAIEPRALNSLVRYGSLLDGGVVISGIQEQPPATIVEFAADGAEVNQWRYWNLGESVVAASPQPNRSDAVAAVRRHLERVAHEQMAPDSPAGLMLSGGIDSSIIAALAKRHGNHVPIAVSIGAKGTVLQTDVEYARLVAGSLGIVLIERWIEDFEVEALIDDWLASVDQPSGDGFNSFIASRVLGPHCKVVLSGLGADELFGGYPHFFPAQTQTVAKSWRQRMKQALPRFLRARDSLHVGNTTRLEQPEEWVARCRTIADPKACLNPWLLNGENAGGAQFSPDCEDDFFRRVSRAELAGYMRGILLRDSDAMSMASSLELRPPFLDHELVNYVFTLPQTLKVDRGRLKPLLVDSCVDLLDPVIATRKKTGFSLPYVKWLQGPLRNRASHALSSPTAQAIFSQDYLMQLKGELKSGAGATFRTWSHWVLVEWCLHNDIKVNR